MFIGGFCGDWTTLQSQKDNAIMRLWQFTIASIGLTTCIIMLCSPAPEGWPPQALNALGLVFLAVGLWSTEILPLHLTSFIIFFIALIFSIAPPFIVFSGFHSGAVWLVFAGIVIGVAVERTGIGANIAEGVVKWFGHSYTGLVFGMGIAGFGSAFLMPSAMGRVVILAPVVAKIAEQLGYETNSRARSGLILTFCFCTVFPAMSILPATVPNVVLAGASENIHGITLHYTDFMNLHFTVAGLGSFIVILILNLLMFRNKQPQLKQTFMAETSIKMTPEGIRLLIILLLTLGFWLTDKVHGIAPAWIGLGASVLCLMPFLKLVKASSLVQGANYSPWFFVAGIIGLGAIVAHTGLAEILAAALIEVVGFETKTDLFKFSALTVIGGILSFALNPAGVPAVLAPMANSIALATGWPLETVLMSQINSFFIIIVPYQAAPIFAGVILTKVPIKYCAQLGVIFSAIYIFFIMPINYFWWHKLDMFS